MRILEVNGTSLLGATHQEAVNALRSAGQKIHLTVCKGNIKRFTYFCDFFTSCQLSIDFIL